MRRLVKTLLVGTMMASGNAATAQQGTKVAQPSDQDDAIVVTGFRSSLEQALDALTSIPIALRLPTQTGWA